MKNIILGIFLFLSLLPFQSWAADFGYTLNEHPQAGIKCISVNSGNWTNPNTWLNNQIPSNLDTAYISAGHTVTINTYNLNVGFMHIDGTLNYGNISNNFTVFNDLNIGSTGVLDLYYGTSGRTIYVGRHLLLDGIINAPYGNLTEGLVFNGPIPQNISGSGGFGASFKNLFFKNTSNIIPNINWNLNNVEVENVLDMNNQKINLNGNTIHLGNSSSQGILFSSNYCGFINGTFRRWWDGVNVGLLDTIIAYMPNTDAGKYPFLSSMGDIRHFFLGRKSPNGTSGWYEVSYLDYETMNPIPSFISGSQTIDQRWKGHYKVNSSGSTASSYQVSIITPTLFNFLGESPYVIKMIQDMPGNHHSIDPNLGGIKDNISHADLVNPDGIFLGYGPSMVVNSTTKNGDWNDPTLWSAGYVPDCNINVKINHDVTLNLNQYSCRSLLINPSGKLSIQSGGLIVGCTDNNQSLINNGSLNVEGGTLTVNGSMAHNIGSSFTQSSGDIIIDGNSGSLATSAQAHLLKISTDQVSWTGGQITIVDPSADSQNYTFYYDSPAHVNNDVGTHTFRFGDGVSFQSGGSSTYGCRIGPSVNGGIISFNNVEFDLGGGNNRFAYLESFLVVNGNLLVNTYTDVHYMMGVSVARDLTVNGNLMGEGSMYFAKHIGGLLQETPHAQTIGGTGQFINTITGTINGNMKSLLINNSSAQGVQLMMPLRVTHNFSLMKGLINNYNNSLYIGSDLGQATFSGGATDAYVNGSLIITVDANNTSEIYFPVGYMNEYAPIYLTPTNSTQIELKVNAIKDGNGQAASGITGLSFMKWSVELFSGYSSSIKPKISHNGITSNSHLVSSNLLGGTYTQDVYGTNSTYISSTPPSLESDNSISIWTFEQYIGYSGFTGCYGTPDPGNTIRISSSACYGKSVEVKTENGHLSSDLGYVWQSSFDGVNFLNIPGATDSILVIDPKGQYVRALVTCLNTMLTAPSNPLQLVLDHETPNIADVNRCGEGYIMLQLPNNNGLNNGKWYKDTLSYYPAVSSNINQFYIKSDTTLYVRNGNYSIGYADLGINATESSGTYAQGNVFHGDSSAYKSQTIITAQELRALGLRKNDAIFQLTYYTGLLYSSNTYASFNLKMGHTNETDVSNTFIPSSSLTHVYSKYLYLFNTAAINLYFGEGATNSNFQWDGVSNIVVEASWTTNSFVAPSSPIMTEATSFQSTRYFIGNNLSENEIQNVSNASHVISYRPKFRLGYNSSCLSDIKEVNVYFTPGPAYSLDRYTDTICVGTSTNPVLLTSNPSSYSYYSVMGGPVSGSYSSGWVLNPTTTTTYTFYGYNNSGDMCASSRDFKVVVQQDQPYIPEYITFSDTACEGATSKIITAKSVGSHFKEIKSNRLDYFVGTGTPVQSHSLQVPNIPAGATITGIDVSFSMSHTWVSDIEIRLINPSGKSEILFDNHGGNGDHFINTVFSSASNNPIALGIPPYYGDYQPSYPLDSLYTGDPNGLWTLEVEDYSPVVDHGKWHDWGIKIYYSISDEIIWYENNNINNIVGYGTNFDCIGNSVISTPAVPGTYFFDARAKRGVCISLPMLKHVHVESLPAVVAPNDTIYCEGELVTLNAQGNANSYTWNNGVVDGTPFVVSAGNYVATGFSAFGCAAKDSLTISTLPSPLVSAGSDIAECYGTQVTLNASGNAASYTWNNGVIDGQSFNLMSGGYYVVTAQSLSGCTAQDSLFATVHSLPTINIGADYSVCEGTFIVLAGIGADTYIWDNGVVDGEYFTPPLGENTYSVIGTDINGCSNTDTIKITVLGNTSVTAAADFSSCENTDAIISAVAINSDYGYWVTNGQGTLAPNINEHQVIYTPADGEVGEIYFVYTGEGICNTDFDTVTVTFNPNPVFDLGADIVTTNATYVLDATSGFTTYAWSTGETTQTITVSQNGSYSVVVTDANGCSGTDTISFITTFSVENVDGSKGSIDVFPNPTKDIVNLQFIDVKANEVKIDVVSMSGAVISTSQASLVEGNGLVVLNLGNVAEGVYIVRMSYNNSVSTHRIVVNK